MRRRAAWTVALALSCLAVRPARAGDDGPLAGLTGARALAYAKEIAAPEMKGRKTGYEGGRLIEEYLQSKLGELGLDPMDRDGIYLQNFTFGATQVEPPIGLAVGGVETVYGKDFVDLLYTGAATVEGEVVFVGYGIRAKDRGWDDYDGVDVKGKVVLALRGAPASRDAEFAVERQIGWKSSLAADLGAAAFLVCEGTTAIPGTIQEKFHRPGLPALWVTSAVADGILAARCRTLGDLKRSRDAGDPGRSFACGTVAKVEVHGRFNPNAPGRNALAGFHGRDPDLRGEVIIVGAHMDHLGTDANGRVFPGADDNGSGSATLLLLAETLAKNGWKPKRTVVFTWFAGEEQGLVGSKHLVEDLPFPCTGIAAVINMDMTGQGKPEVSIGGGEGYPALYAKATGFVPEPYRSTLKPFRVEGNSDHWPFYERGIPAFFALTQGDHPNYHQVGDVPENLKPECLEAAARVVGSIVVGLGEDPAPLVTGREVGAFVLREGARVVEGPASAKAMGAVLDAPKGAVADRTSLQGAGHAAVVLAVDDTGDSSVALARVREAARARAADTVVVTTASDLVNAARGGRTAIVARMHCARTAVVFPAVLQTYRDLGIRWVAPFDRQAAAVGGQGGAVPPAEAQRDAVLDAAIAAKVIVDLTGLPKDALAAARARLGDRPATLRVSGPLAVDAIEAGKALTALRTALGPNTLLVLSGGAEDPLLTQAALAAAEPDGLAPVLVASEDTDRLEGLLATASSDLADPNGASRKRVRALFGGAFAELLRRL